ncbi:MAG: hypothetical protein ACFFG0_17955 [Candidatus Thorarchaeota archaeon]
MNEIWDKELPNLGDKKKEDIDTSDLRIKDISSLRMKMGLYITNDELEKIRKKELKKKIP